MSDDEGSPVGSPQDYQPQSPQAEADFMPESPTQSPGAQAVYDENAPVSPSQEEEDEAVESPPRSPYNEDNGEESQEQIDHQPISPEAEAQEDEEAIEEQEHTGYEAEERGDEEEEEAPQEERMPDSPVAADNDDEGEHDEEALSSPSKRAVKRARIDSDDEDEEKADEDRTRSGGEDEEEDRDVKPAIKKRVVDSDDSDDDGEKKEEGEEGEGEGEGEGDEQEVGNLMANIFGDESDEEGGGERDGERKKRDDDSDDELGGGGGGGGGGRRSDDDANVEWDFDVMLRNKKAEKKSRRKRKRDGGIDIINDDDGTIEQVVTAMKKAASEDRHSNKERQPATRKRAMLQTVKNILLRSDLVETMIDGGMMSAISEWLAPLPDKSLPALEIRSELLKILQGFARLDQGVLKQSGLGKAVMMLFKHPRETKDNKKLAHKLISDWARPIFQIDTDFRSMTREDRMERDFAQGMKRRKSTDESSSRGGFRDAQEDLRPGMKGYIGRARVPKISSKDYVVRPASLVEGTFKGEKKGKGNERLDRATRDFQARTKAMKVKRAIGVSIEGRRMEI
ncbi:hypothetical protein PRIPAC_74159 [Pristionchus pacificus]|uniref:IWS1-like protein n=1 Tax=Pristionchus pacificus TaxID=54126 RepID=A0A2A6B501_PRIPA|nr:hypothetical protein PRIPAC_74159 [Pristionchus pacificus]|eukprot:PDM60956.1 hypothetical protein PRIPAC_54762 [Pristionchus pacificus]